MVGSRQMAPGTLAAQRTPTRCLIGEAEQLQSIEAAAAFRRFAEQAGYQRN